MFDSFYQKLYTYTITSNKRERKRVNENGYSCKNKTKQTQF